MANHKSAIKRHKQSLKRRARNRNAKSSLKSSLKKVEEAIKAGDKAEAKKLFVQAERALASAATKKIIHKGNASRRISRLAAKVNG
ncbi:MAG: 30S ribosomal protein S20 [Deltaproteobacteria bacterium]|nr:30S ribosomal protein S20 [Deltaproteobacteria bacterium]